MSTQIHTNSPYFDFQVFRTEDLKYPQSLATVANSIMPQATLARPCATRLFLQR
jgi:hypothetical protein